MDTLEPAAKDLPVCPDEKRGRAASTRLDARWPAAEIQQRSSTHSGNIRWQELLAVYSTRDRVTILLLLGFSLLVRIVAWQLIFSGNRHAGEVWDAYGYYFRATGFEQMLLDLFQGRFPSDEARLIAYSSHWPPLQAGLLSLAFLLFGSKIIVGQAMMVSLSTLTTLFVYLITAKVSSRRAAIIAAMIHAVYPSFIHLSLRLLSETTYIFFSLLAIYLVLTLVETTRRRWAWLLAVGAGLLLGLSALARAAALPWVGMLALWIGWRIRGTRLRLLLPAAMLAVTAVTVLPWEVALFRAEGRFVLLATSGEENLLRGNNPWIPEGFGSHGLLTMPKMLEASQQYAEQHGVSDKEADRELALIEIRKDPAGFVERGFYKLRELWSVDSDIVLFILTIIYPPLRAGLAAAILLATLAALPILQALAVWGLLAPKPALRARELFVALTAGTMVVIFVT
ncbi:MAG: glycosyltransferase family 39 protein, partial [Caldilineaceae bacterium]|nr:glycosyltransferase family 39 protein [Caldilineaceae bacterium]